MTYHKKRHEIQIKKIYIIRLERGSLWWGSTKTERKKKRKNLIQMLGYRFEALKRPIRSAGRREDNPEMGGATQGRAGNDAT